jgi:poly(hydroxyalkanoate) granule-associated protein
MTKKLTTPEREDEALAMAVRASAQQIWQAGLGAFAKARQEEGGRAFSRLVREGNGLQQRARGVDDTGDTVVRAAERATRRGPGSWGKLEQVFEERVARALAAIGAPERPEIDALAARIAELEKTVAALAPPKPARKRTAR